MLYEYDFTGRKPSIVQIKKQVSEGIKQNASMILISWGKTVSILRDHIIINIGPAQDGLREYPAQILQRV